MQQITTTNHGNNGWNERMECDRMLKHHRAHLLQVARSGTLTPFKFLKQKECYCHYPERICSNELQSCSAIATEDLKGRTHRQRA